jgi:hypothetical protein
MDTKVAIALGLAKRFILPALLGSLVVWLIANEPEWVPVVCKTTANLGMELAECYNAK